MTNEELVRQYYDGDEAALDKLYRRNLGLIRSIAKEAAREFNCLHMDSDRPEEFSGYTKTILDDLCGEGALEFLTRLQDREYDESRAKLTTYLYPHLKGRMLRWLEQSIGNLALSKDEMAAVREAQKLYHTDWLGTDEIAEKLGISQEEVSRHIGYNTHFLSVYDIGPADYDGDPFERLMPEKLSTPADRIAYRNVCIDLLREMFESLPKKERDILGKCCGIFGFPKTPLKEIGMHHRLKVSAVEKAKNRAIKKLKKAYPGSKLELWRKVYWLVKNTH